MLNQTDVLSTQAETKLASTNDKRLEDNVMVPTNHAATTERLKREKRNWEQNEPLDKSKISDISVEKIDSCDKAISDMLKHVREYV